MRNNKDNYSSSFEMGLNSIVSILGDISKSNNNGIKLLENINNNVDKLNNFMGESLSLFMGTKLQPNVQSINGQIISTKLDVISLTLDSIAVNLDTLLDRILEKAKIKENSPEEIVKKSANVLARLFTGNNTTVVHTNLNDDIQREGTLAQNVLLSESNSWLNKISGQLEKIYTYLPKIGSGESEIDQKAESKSFDLLNIARGVKSLKKEMTKGFINNFDSFMETLEKFLSLDTQKLAFVGASLTTFTTILGYISNQAENIASNFNKMSFSILVLSLMLISPPFLLGGAVLIGIIWGIRKAIGRNFAANWAFGKLAKGILFLTIAMWAMSKIPFESVMKTIVLVGALSAVIGMFMSDKNGSTFSIGLSGIKTTSTGGIKGMINFAMGISILVLALSAMDEIPYTSIFKMITFIGLLGITLKLFDGGKFNGKGSPSLMSFGIGIGILVLSLYAVNDVEWQATLKLVGFIALLGITLKLFYGGKPGLRGGAPSLTSFAIGIGILVLSMYAMQEMEWGTIFKTVVFIGLLGIALQTFRKNIPGLFLFSIGFGILVLTMFVVQEIPENTFKITVLFIAGLGLATQLLSKTGALNLLLIATSLAIFAASLLIVALTPITIEKTLIFVGSILLMAGVSAALGIPAVAALVGLGSVVMIALGIATLVIASTLMVASIFKINVNNLFTLIGGISLLAIGFSILSPFILLASVSAILFLPVAISALLISTLVWTISKLDIDFVTIARMLGSIMLFATTFALITPLAIVAGIGSIFMLPVVITAMLMATSMMMLKNLTFENVGAFLLAIGGLATTFAFITPLAIVAAIGATLMMPVMLSALWSAAVLMNITKLEITPNKLENFNMGLKSIITSMGQFGITELAKTALKSALLIPIGAATLLSALALRAISGLDISESKIESFGIIMNKFITSMVSVVNDNVENLKKVEPGLKALSQLVNVGSDLVDIVTSFANMNYNVYEVKDGKLKLVGVRKITDEEIAQVGVNVGKLIQGLIVPLSILSSDDEVWNFGNGVTVKNPFKGGWFGTDKNSGINRLSKIGGAFLPLTEAIKNISGSTMLQNKEELNNFNTGIVSIIDTLTNIFQRLEGWETKNSDESVKSIVDFVESFDKLNGGSFNSINDTMTKFLNNLSDEDRWTKIHTNLNLMKESFKDISKNINMLNLEKALVLERNLKLLSEAETNENLKEVVEKLTEMISLITESQGKLIDSMQQNQVSQPTQQTIQKEEKIKEEKFEGFEDVKTLLSDIAEKLNLTNIKLGGKLKVVPITGNSNSL